MSDAQTEFESHQVKFTGTASEYFGVWIVNVLLTIITFGIYAFWARVRNKKYFAGHTTIDGHAFDYHATGGQLFVGALIAGLVISLIQFSAFIHIFVPVVLLIVVLGFLPWLIVRAVRFNARMTSYRNVRFDFQGKAGGAFFAYLVMPVVAVLTLYTTWPFADRARQRFLLNKHLYGGRSFNFDAPIGLFYKPFLILIGLALLALAVIGGVVVLAFTSGSMVNFSIVQPLILLAFIAIPTAALTYYALIRNVIYENLTLDGKHRFRSTIKVGKTVWIIVTNMLAIVFTVGLMLPWARVRWAKYLADNTFLLAGGPLDGYHSEILESDGAATAEYLDAEGFDIGVSI